MVAEIEKFVRSCIVCVKVRGGTVIPRPLAVHISAERPREMIHFDFLTMVLSDTGLRYLLVIKDDFTGFLLLWPSAATDAAHALQGLMHWFSIFGVADMWLSDCGSHFRNTLIKSVQRLLKTEHHFTTPYASWAQILKERIGKCWTCLNFC